MSFNTNDPRAEYTAATGQTDFPFDYQVFQDSDMVVYQTLLGQLSDDTADLLTLTTDYTVDILGDEGGTVTLNVGATAGDMVTLTRDLPIDRPFEYQQRGDLRSETLNADQDYQTQLTNDVKSQDGRNVKLQNSSQGVSPLLPAPISDGYIKWNTAADALVNDTTIPDNVLASQESAWISTAQALTSGSYAVQPEDVFVNIFTSNGDGTYTATPSTDYSSLHHAAKSEDSADEALVQADRAEGYADSIDPASLLNKSSTAQTKTGNLTVGQEITIDSWSYVSTTITINTAVDHGLTIGQEIRIDGLVSTTNTPQGMYEVATVEDADTITFIAADTPTGSPTVSSATLNSGDIETKGKFIGKNACTAFVHFDGVATPPTIKKSFNVNDVSKTGTGEYIIHFETPMVDLDFIATGMSGDRTSTISAGRSIFCNGLATLSTFPITNKRIDTNIAINDFDISINIFGGKE